MPDNKFALTLPEMIKNLNGPLAALGTDDA
jgi:hypothetical protein